MIAFKEEKRPKIHFFLNFIFYIMRNQTRWIWCILLKTTKDSYLWWKKKNVTFIVRDDRKRCTNKNCLNKKIEKQLCCLVFHVKCLHVWFFCSVFASCSILSLNIWSTSMLCVHISSESFFFPFFVFSFCR